MPIILFFLIIVVFLRSVSPLSASSTSFQKHRHGSNKRRLIIQFRRVCSNRRKKIHIDHIIVCVQIFSDKRFRKLMSTIKNERNACNANFDFYTLSTRFLSAARYSAAKRLAKVFFSSIMANSLSRC